MEAVLRYQPARAKKLYARSGEALLQLATSLDIATRVVDPDRLDALAPPGLSHQGVVLDCGPFMFCDAQDALAAEPTLVLLLDGVEDPRNLGAAVRAGHALGVELVVIPARRAAGPTASAHRAAAGALSRVPIAQVDNVRRFLDACKKGGMWIVGAEADAPALPWQVDLASRICLVIGGEDRGVRRLNREACDHMLNIPMAAPDVSLNAADAATVLLYEVRRQRALKSQHIEK